MKHYRLVALMVIFLGTISTGTLPAQETFFDTGAFDTVGWAIAGYQVVADQVLLEESWQLEQLSVVAVDAGGMVRNVIMFLMTDQDGLPGDIITQWDVPTSFRPLWQTAATESRPVLDADTPYWFAMFPGSLGRLTYWHTSRVANGPVAVSLDQGRTWAVSKGSLGSLRLKGVQVER